MQIAQVIKKQGGNRIYGYVVEDSMGDVKVARKDDLVGVVRDDKIENAYLQMYNGSPIIRIKDKARVTFKCKYASLVTGSVLVSILGQIKAPVEIKIGTYDAVNQNSKLKKAIYTGWTHANNGADYIFSFVTDAGTITTTASELINNTFKIVATFDV